VTFNPITIGVVGTNCDGNLAFTGGTIAWLGFVLAGGMLFLGFALLYMRRRGNRTAE
jgi:chromate transport protein ChrA